MSSEASFSVLPWRVSFRITSALPSIKPSIAVKYRVSTAFGSGFVESLIWALAVSGMAAANRQAARSKGARIANFLWDGDWLTVLANLCDIRQKEGRPEAAFSQTGTWFTQPDLPAAD